MAVTASPSTPTESSTAAPGGGFSTWFRNIGDWIKLLSPSGASQYETDWVDITLASGYQLFNIKPQVKRVGKEVFFRGGIQVNSGTFTNSAIITIGTVPPGFTPGYWQEAQTILAMGGNGGQFCSGNVDPAGALSIRVPAGVSASSVSLKALSGYTVG